MHPAEAVVLDLLLAVAGLDPARGADELVVRQFVQPLVRVGFADEEEVGSEIENEAAEGLAAVQVVAQDDRALGAQLGEMAGQPALGGVAFTVLFLDLLGEFGAAGGRVLLGLDEGGQERQHAVLAVGDDGRREHGVEALHGLVSAHVAGRALFATAGIRATMHQDAVERDQEATAEAFKGLEGAFLAQGVEAQREELAEGIGSDAVEQVADLVVVGDVADAEESLAVGEGGLVLNAALEIEERRGLEEEQKEGAGSGLGDGVALVASVAGIGPGGGALGEGGQERL